MAHRWDPRAPSPGRLVRPVPVDPRGISGPTRRQASGRYWRRTSSGRYVPVDTRTDLPEQRIVEQAARVPAYAAVTGWAACRLHGGQFFDGLDTDGSTPLPVDVNVGPHGNLRPDGEVRACFHRLDPADRAVRHGIATVTAVRATYDAARLAPDLREAVVALDMMAAAGLVSLRQVREYAESLGRRDRQVPAALALASEHSRSPNETRLRLSWRLDAHLGPPLVNCPVHDMVGRLLGILDLLDEEAGHGVEFDGADHRRARRQTSDIHREERLRKAGLEITRVTGLELPDRTAVAARLVAGQERALLRADQPRLWVARPPRDDLHQRLAEERFLEEQRESWHRPADRPPG